MNAMTQTEITRPQTILTDEITSGADYEIVRKVIETISETYQDQPSLETLAADVGMEPTALQKILGILNEAAPQYYDQPDEA